MRSHLPAPKGAELPIFGPSLLWPNGWMGQNATRYGGRPRLRPHCGRWGLSSPKMGGYSPHPQFSTNVYIGQTAGWIKMPLSTEVGLGPGDIVLDGDPATQKMLRPPILRPCLLWPNDCMHQDTTWYESRPQPRRLCVTWRPSPLPKKGARPQFSAHLYCGQTAGCIKMPLGVKVGLSPGDFVLDGYPATYRKWDGAPSNFRPKSIVAKRLHGSRFHWVQR